MFDITKVKKVRSVSLPHFKMVKDVTRYFKITSPIVQTVETVSRRELSEEQQATRASLKKKAPPEVCQVVDLETGQEGMIITNSVLASTLDTEYPNAGYVGKCFSILKFEIQGKDYAGFTVTEIDVESGGENEVADAGPKGARK